MSQNPKKLKTIQLDLKLRHPKKYYFKFENYFLVFREPSFEDLQLLESIKGIELLHKKILRYCEWSDENLLEIISFIDYLPFRTYAYLLQALEEFFKADQSIEASDLSDVNLNALSPVGSINTVLTARKNYETKKETAELFNKLMEALGVYIKAPKPNTEPIDPEAPRSTAWVPLTQMINPEGFQSVYGKLVYDGPTEPEKPIEAEKKEQNSTTERKNERISLSTLDREEYVKMIYQNANLGFLKAAGRGISQNAYRAALEQGVDPLVRDDRTKLMTQNEERPQKETITLRSRWKGGK